MRDIKNLDGANGETGIRNLVVEVAVLVLIVTLSIMTRGLTSSVAQANEATDGTAEDAGIPIEFYVEHQVSQEEAEGIIDASIARNPMATEMADDARMAPEEDEPDGQDDDQDEGQDEGWADGTTPATPVVNGTASLDALLAAADSTGKTDPSGGCSGWVHAVFKNAGITKWGGCAADYCNAWCTSSDLDDLRPGMIIAVTNTGGSAAGRKYGHVGIYIGNGTVRHFLHSKDLLDTPLDEWISTFGSVVTPRWGWNAGIVLS